MIKRLPKGWHSYDETCECGACERDQPSSPYQKVRAGQEETAPPPPRVMGVYHGLLIGLALGVAFWAAVVAAVWWALS